MPFRSARCRAVSPSCGRLRDCRARLDDGGGSRAANERAYREYMERHDLRGAARVAIQLAVYHDAYRGESAIASGWFERARTLLDAVPAAPEHAWLAFWKAHLDIHVHGEWPKRAKPRDAIRLKRGNIGGDGTDDPGLSG